jgi:hypothetical protein
MKRSRWTGLSEGEKRIRDLVAAERRAKTRKDKMMAERIRNQARREAAAEITGNRNRL